MDPRAPQAGGAVPHEDTALYATPPAVPPTEAFWVLVRYVGVPLGEVVLLAPPALGIGRAALNALVLADPEVSREHARLDLAERPGGLEVEIADLGSTNGTFVNGHRLPQGGRPVPLRDGDVLRVGGHAFKLRRMDALELQFHQALLAQSTLDALTGLSNRATVLAFLDKQAGLACRHHRPLSVILADLDHFKAVNDRLGHAAGDVALAAFGRLVLDRVRGTDLVGRIGGEEFLVVLPETPLREAAGVADSLRTRLEALPVELPESGEVLRLTASFGVAQLLPEEGSGGVLLARADAALYRAKALGRNRVEHDT